MQKMVISIVSFLLVYSLQASDIRSSPLLIEGSKVADDGCSNISAENISCAVNGQEYRLSDLIKNAIWVVGLNSNDIIQLKRDSQTMQSCVNEHAKTLKECVDAINTNGKAIPNHAAFINKQQALLSNTTYEINKAWATYLVAGHPIIKSLTARCYAPEESAVVLTTLLVEGSLGNVDGLLSTQLVACKTLGAIGISKLTDRLVNRCGLNQYAQSESSKMATFVTARVASHHVINFLVSSFLQYINQNYSFA